MEHSQLRKVVIIIFCLLAGIQAQGQKYDITEGFSMKISLGALSFHGDLSASEYNPVDIIRDNTKMGFSFSALKEFSNIIGVQAQYFAGNLYSIHSDENLYFTGSLSEFSVSGRFTPLGLFPGMNNRLKLNPYLSFGLGTFGYRSCRRYIDTDDIYPPVYGYQNDGVTTAPRERSLTIPMGIGLSVPINQNFAIELDHTFRITNTDLIDATVSPTSSNDFYSHTSLGFRFTINQPKATRPASRSAFKPSDKVDKEENDKEIERAKKAEAPLNIFIESKMDDVVTSGNILSVNLRINKGGYTGPAKLIQRFPEGFHALEASSTNGRFSFNNRNALIEWDNMPEDSMLIFTYYVRVGKEVAGSQTITGRFEYEEKDRWNTIRFNNYIFADNRVEEYQDLEDVKKEEHLEVSIDVPEKEAKIAEPEKNKTEKEYQIDPLIVKDPLPDVEFRVQCGAFRDSNKGGKFLAERYGITEDMREIYENGWYKYTVGSFKSYVEAVNFKNSFINRTKLYTAFVVAYRNGKRVEDIREAFK